MKRLIKFGDWLFEKDIRVNTFLALVLILLLLSLLIGFGQI